MLQSVPLREGFERRLLGQGALQSLVLPLLCQGFGGCLRGRCFGFSPSFGCRSSSLGFIDGGYVRLGIEHLPYVSSCTNNNKYMSE